MGWLEQTRISWMESTLSRLKKTARRGGAVAGQPAHLVTGIDGEDAAFFYLRRKGYIVVARRWTSNHQRGDLDLIAWHGPMLCFIEVKTRTAHDMAPAEATVDDHKRNTLRKLARHYVRQLPMKTLPPVRFDILSVYLVPGMQKEFVHFEAAFGLRERTGWDRWDDWA
jgi:putative endonuclease